MNKRFFTVLLSIMAVGGLLFSCASPEPKVSVIAFGNKIQNITFSAGETSKTEWLYFTEAWNCDNTADWLEVSPMQYTAPKAGKLDSLEVTFTVLSPAQSERKVGVTFTQNDAMVRIPVIQKATMPSE